jgi:histidine ammonia-lyase
MEPQALSVGRPIGIHDVHTVAREGRSASLCPDARVRLAATRDSLEQAIASGATIYGVNTGFGALSEARISADELGALQLNLLRSHAVGVGAPLEDDVVRALLLLRAHTLALGACGVSAELPRALLDLLAADVLPVVPAQGSVGASGDLAPLSHLALVLVGEGAARRGGRTVPGATALLEAGLTPLRLRPKEGLSLINGTQVTTAIAALAVHDAAELTVAADVIGALSLDAHLGSTSICDPRIHAGKPHPGQRRSARIVAELAAGSALNRSHADCGVVQDAYSFRCLPQVHGTVRTAVQHAAQTIVIELNSFTDNPLVLARDDGGFDVLSGGNFHAAAVALAADHVAAALCTLGTISERRGDRFMGPATSRGLPAFLADEPGLQSGLMMAQVTAAALASECKSLAHPASVDTIPTSAGKEDHVSMGPIAARKLAAIVQHVARILAIEATIAARALDLREHPTSARLEAVRAAVRRHVAPHAGDRSLGAEIEALAAAIVRGELREAAGIDPDWGEPAFRVSE